MQPRGQTTLLIGENGSGKSTLVDAMLTLLVRPQTGTITWRRCHQKTKRDETNLHTGCV